MEKGLITVIVPVYNTEKYLDRCVESIVSQTYRNLEIILVDDGSTDSCPRKCDQWAEKDSRIRVIHQENAGQSVARNVGLDIAAGEYIVFVDSDDYISQEHILELYHLAEMYRVDMAVCELVCINDRGKPISKTINDGKVELFDTLEALYQLLEGNLIKHGPYSKLYSSRLFSYIRFPEGRLYEDLGTTYKLIMKCTKVAVLRRISYFCVFRSNSSTRNEFSTKYMDGLWMADKMNKDILMFYPELKEKTDCSFFGICVNLLQKVDKRKNKVSYEELDNKIQELKKNILFATSVNTKMRLFAAISYFGTGMLYLFLKWIFNPLRKIVKKADV